MLVTALTATAHQTALCAKPERTAVDQTGSSIAIVGANLRRNAASEEQVPPTALLVRDGLITQLGDDKAVRTAAAEDGIQVLDVKGATVTPGLFDSHTHPLWAVNITAGVDLGGITTPEGLQAALHKEAERVGPDGWVRGWNLEYEVFRDVGIDRAVIEQAVGERPTILIFYDLHTGLATQTALTAAGITGPVEFHDTSEIVVAPDGRLTGELREMTAFRMVSDAKPPYSAREEADALRDMFHKLGASGLTGGAIMDGTERTRELLAELENRGELTQRMTVHQWHAVHFDDGDVERIIAAKHERGRLWQGGAIKLFSDGVVDTGTAWLHHPDTCGGGKAAFWPDWDRFREVVHNYDAAGMTIATHAVGDRAVSEVLAVYSELPPRPAELAQHSIEHLEVLSDADISQLGSSNVTASMQPLHMQWRSPDLSDNWATRLGEPRSANGFRAKSVLNAGARLVLGSDWPVATYDPRVGMAWARGRTDPLRPHESVFEPDERLSGDEALLAYTLWPAQARGHADRGHLSVGAVGDLTVWAEDPASVSPAEIVDTEILWTIVDGRVVYEQP
jgi:predicted amidohydrolase YtcJ